MGGFNEAASSTGWPACGGTLAAPAFIFPRSPCPTSEKCGHEKPCKDQQAETGESERIGERGIWRGSGEAASLAECGHGIPSRVRSLFFQSMFY